MGVVASLFLNGHAGVESFETESAGWQAEGGAATVSDAHWKLGARSLRWDFTPGSKLLRAEDEVLRKAVASRDGGIKLWIYCENPVAGDLQVQIGKWVFPVHLGFTGWRAVWVSLQEDAKPAAPINGMQITAPPVAGTLFIDAVEIGTAPWFRQGDAQVPFTNPTRSGGKYWFTAQDDAAVKPPSARGEITTEERAAFRELEKRYEAWMFDRSDDPRGPVRQRMKGVADFIASANKAFEQLGLQRRGDIVVGPGVFCVQDSLTPQLGSEVFRKIALGLAYDARLNNSERAKQRFLDLLDYAHDQGWAAGSLLGTDYDEPLRIMGYVHSVHMMRDYLKQQGRLERELETLRYHLHFGEMYREAQHPGMDADSLRSLLMFRFTTILMEEDSPEKVRDMESWVKWADSALSIAPGRGDTIKPDGTVFHHATAYTSAYGNEAVMMGSLAYWLVRDTRFALSREAGENLKKALLALRFMAGQYEFPLGVSGRFPFEGPVLAQTCQAMGYMADALHDEELGAAFARLWNPEVPAIQAQFPSCGQMSRAIIFWCDPPGALPWLLDASTRWKPESDPQGHRSYPYAAMDFHRRRQWVASVRGWSKYVWHYEELGNDNRHGRYGSHGTLQIFGKGSPVDQKSSGCRIEGWDWLRPPGATVIRVPIETLAESPILQRSYTNDPFVGGVTLGGRDGLWAMRFTDPVYDKSFRFRKSVFFVDETIVCCGSGITNNDTKNPTETVLFQTALAQRPEPFPSSATQTVTTLMDPVDNGYFFPQPQTVEVRAQHQASPGGRGKTPTEGDFKVAWIDHGTAPKDAGYAYAIRPDTTSAALAKFAKAPGFEILQRNDSAHIVRFPSRGIIGYALFSAVDNLDFSALRGADIPCLVMTRGSRNQLGLAVADPDLRLPPMAPGHFDYRPGATSTFRLRLNGAWKLNGAPDGVRMIDGQTLEITARDGATREATLSPASWKSYWILFICSALRYVAPQ